jgi:hypothetical protein
MKVIDMNQKLDGRLGDAKIEEAIQAKGLTAPRVTPEQVNALVDSLIFQTHRFPGTTSTVAAAILPNGFVVAVGHSAAASRENFDAEIGEAIAISNAKTEARKKLWELEGYVLKKAIG